MPNKINKYANVDVSFKHFIPAMYSSTIIEYEDNKSRKLTLGTQNGKNSILDQPPKENIPAVQPLIWRNVIGIPVLHVIAIYLFITRYNQAKLWTWIFSTFYLNHIISSPSFIIPSFAQILNQVYNSDVFCKI